jgi:hypothetical protein
VTGMYSNQLNYQTSALLRWQRYNRFSFTQLFYNTRMKKKLKPLKIKENRCGFLKNSDAIVCLVLNLRLIRTIKIEFSGAKKTNLFLF